MATYTRRNPHDSRGRYHGVVKGTASGRVAKIHQYTEGGDYHVMYVLVHRDGEEQVVGSPKGSYKTLAAAERKARTFVDDVPRKNPAYETKRGFQGRDRADAEAMQRDYDFTNVPFQRAHAARKRREAAAQAAAHAEADARWGRIEAGFTPEERARYAVWDAEDARARRVYDAEKRIEALRAARRGGSRLPNAGGGRRKKTPYDTKFNRDGTVTLWDAYTQSWDRTSQPSDRDLASLDAADRARVIRHLHKNPGGMTAEWSPANQAWIVLYGGKPSRLGTGRGNYYPDKTELKHDLATLGLKLTGNRITAAAHENPASRGHGGSQRANGYQASTGMHARKWPRPEGAGTVVYLAPSDWDNVSSLSVDRSGYYAREWAHNPYLGYPGWTLLGPHKTASAAAKAAATFQRQAK